MARTAPASPPKSPDPAQAAEDYTARDIQVLEGLEAVRRRPGRSARETVMTYPHAGGKFGGQVYKVSGGLHGVGASVVNALSSDMWVEVRRDGRVYRQEGSLGIPTSELRAAR